MEKDNVVMETKFNNLTVKCYNNNNDITDNFQGDGEEQRDNDDVTNENNIP